MFNFFTKKEAVPTKSITIATPVVLETPTTYQDIRPQWKALAAKKELTSSDMAALAIYKSLVKGGGKEGAISRLKKSFRPITSPTKLANGADPHLAVTSSLRGIKYSNIAGWLTPAELKVLNDLAQEIAKEWK